MILIGLTGPAGSGKTLLARHLARHYDFMDLAFADPIKEMVATLLGMDREQFDRLLMTPRDAKEAPLEFIGQSPRYMLQTLGTEWGRQLIHPDLWVIAMRLRLERMQQYNDITHANVVIEDVRFENEAHFIRTHGGVLIHVKRPGIERMAHLSETGIAQAPSDLVLENDGRINDAFLKIDAILRRLIEQQAA